MEKPDWTYEPIHKDVYSPRIMRTIETLRENMNSIEREALKTITDGAYLEGLLDGFRVMDYIQHNFF